MFKNVMIYQVELEPNFNAEALDDALLTVPARPCGNTTQMTYGFAPVIGDEGSLVHEVDGFVMLKARREDRKVPAATLNAEVKKKCREIEEREARKVYRKEKEVIEEEVLHTLLPRAFVKVSEARAVIDVREGLIFIEGSSATVAEDFLSAMRKALGSLKVRPLRTKVTPYVQFTSWLKAQSISDALFFGNDCELRDVDEGGIVRITGDDLTGDEVQLHLTSGKVAVSLAVKWKGELSFVLTQDLVMKKLKQEGMLKQEVADIKDLDGHIAQLDAELVLMMRTFREVVPAVIDAVGGLEQREAI